MININLNTNKKRLIIGVAIFIIITIWIAGIIISKKEKSLREGTQTPVPSPTAIPFTSPESANLNIDGVEVNNFYKDAILTGEDGYALFDKTPKYKIAYIPVDKSFLISIIDNPFEEDRRGAEIAFLQKIGVSKEDACLLKVNIATNIRIN